MFQLSLGSKYLVDHRIVYIEMYNNPITPWRNSRLFLGIDDARAIAQLFGTVQVIVMTIHNMLDYAIGEIRRRHGNDIVARPHTP